VELDCRGMRCPLPIIHLARAIKDVNADEQVILRSDDPATEPDLRAWSRMTGHHFEKIAETEFLITPRSV
jgi:tRNA 2-thiouridine synthesizing protein A